MVRGRELIVVGEGTELFVEKTPERLYGKSLAESEIGASTGLNVVAIRENGRFDANPSADSVLTESSELVMLGSAEQRQSFLALGQDSRAGLAAVFRPFV